MNSKYIIFQLYEDICALKVEEVHEIVELESMIKTNSAELNLAIWRNNTLPVIDPIALMALSNHYPTVHSRIIVIEENALKFGIIVDRIIGIVELDERTFEDPSLTDPRYVRATTEDYKIFTPAVFLSEQMIKKFRDAYSIDLTGMDDAEVIMGEKAFGKEQVVEKVRLRSMNWLISATRENVQENFIKEALEIHNLVSKLQ